MNVCVFTGTRADYGLLQPVMARIKADPELTLQVLASGSHLSERHGRTVKAIEADGFTVDATVPLPLDEDTPVGVAAATGEAVAGCARALDALRPDMLVVLGDRYEGLAACVAAALLRVPVAHIHGGESTEGAVDDFFRHAMTKMAHLHFTSCEAYRDRVVQLGEAPDRVFAVGALGVENARTLALLEKNELEKALDFAMGDACLLATYHPETLDAGGERSAREAFRGIELALEASPEARMILTGANADPGGAGIDALAAALRNSWPDRVLTSPSLGQLRYLSAMRHCRAVVGNSSSGILEAPSFGVPTVNIGDRQKGRIRATSVIDVPSEAEAVAGAVRQALGPFAEVAKETVNPYERKGTSERIVEEIKRYPGGVTKPFYDLQTIESPQK